MEGEVEKYMIMNEIVTYINEIPIKRNFFENLPYNIKLKSRARALRKAGNYPEVVFWQQVHKGKFYKIDFDRQRIVGNYIVDFYCVEERLVIELDGSVHDNIGSQLYDDERTSFLESLDIKVIRFENSELFKSLDFVIEAIRQAFKQA